MRSAVLFFSAFAGIASGHKFKDLMLSKFKEVRDYAESYLEENNMPYQPSPDYPYWNFMPQYVTSMLPGVTTTWTSPCFASNEGTVAKNADGSAIDVKIVSSGPTSKFCQDIYLTMTVASCVKTGSVTISSTTKDSVTTEYSMVYPLDATDAEEWDYSTKGVRVLQYVNLTTPEAYSNIIKTFEMFIPEFTLHVPTKVAEMNIDMLSKYAHFDITPRDPKSNRIPDPSEVHSGDSFYIMRLDGLNPLLGWAMGSTTGHVTTAIWFGDELYVAESTIDDSYWPTDHVQKTPYYTWMKQAQEADFQVVWVPLNEDARKMYNETAAVEWFNSQEGFDYGFKTLIWGWLDTAKDNMPCLPPDFTVCFSWELAEPLLAFIDRKVNEIGDEIWNPGYNMRLGTEGLRTAALYQEAANQGMQSVDVISMPELDTYIYETTRYDEPAEGRCMVCCVFVCSMWKAAGVFGDMADEINCAEQTNFNDYSMTIHGDSYEQIIGSYSLYLNDFKTIDPYPHMSESCPSHAPDYVQTEGC